jgi:hypothetical protein
MMPDTRFKFWIKDMHFEQLENFKITLFLLFHPLHYSIYLVKIVIQKDDGMIILSSVEFENTNNFLPS